MRFSTVVAFLLPIVAVSADTKRVIVGKDGQKVFDPVKLDGVKAGDTIAFQFVSNNHSVTQSTFASPCTPMDKGVNSGFFKINDGSTSFPQWSFTLDEVKGPLWFFCQQTGHCSGSGMVFAVNPTADKSFEAFQAKAKGGSAPSGNSTTGANSSSAGSTATGGSGSTPTTTGTSSDSSTGTSAASSPTGSKGSGIRHSGNTAGLLTLTGLILGLTI